MKNQLFNNIVWKEGKYYVAQCINVDVSSFGTTKSDALAQLDEALTLYFEGSKRKTYTKIEHAEIVSSVHAYA